MLYVTHLVALEDAEDPAARGGVGHPQVPHHVQGEREPQGQADCADDGQGDLKRLEGLASYSIPSGSFVQR